MRISKKRRIKSPFSGNLTPKERSVSLGTPNIQSFTDFLVVFFAISNKTNVTLKKIEQ
jgi:hypothetical protein